MRTSFPFVLIALAAACGGTADLDSNEDDATAASYHLFTVRRDERKCAAPMCGGFWATAISEDASPVYVADLDLSRAGLSSESVVRSAPGEELLLRARISKGKLIVKDAWRG